MKISVVSQFVPIFGCISFDGNDYLKIFLHIYLYLINFITYRQQTFVYAIFKITSCLNMNIMVLECLATQSSKPQITHCYFLTMTQDWPAAVALHSKNMFSWLNQEEAPEWRQQIEWHTVAWKAYLIVYFFTRWLSGRHHFIAQKLKS